MLTVAGKLFHLNRADYLVRFGVEGLDVGVAPCKVSGLRVAHQGALHAPELSCPVLVIQAEVPGNIGPLEGEAVVRVPVHIQAATFLRELLVQPRVVEGKRCGPPVLV